MDQIREVNIWAKCYRKFPSLFTKYFLCTYHVANIRSGAENMVISEMKLSLPSNVLCSREEDRLEK